MLTLAQVVRTSAHIDAHAHFISHFSYFSFPILQLSFCTYIFCTNRRTHSHHLSFPSFILFISTLFSTSRLFSIRTCGMTPFDFTPLGAPKVSAAVLRKMAGSNPCGDGKRLKMKCFFYFFFV